MSKIKFLNHLKNNNIDSILESVVDTTIDLGKIEKSIVNNIQTYSYGMLKDMMLDIIENQDITSEEKTKIFDKIAIFLWKEYNESSKEIYKYLDNFDDVKIVYFNSIVDFINTELKNGFDDNKIIDKVIYKNQHQIKEIANVMDITSLATLIERALYNEKVNILLHDIKEYAIKKLF